MTTAREHKNNPCNQPFQITGSKNKKKKSAWFSPGSKTYWKDAQAKKNSK